MFFGTPEFAVPSLAALCAAGRRPILVVSQPARPVGRHRRPQDPPVAVWAKAEGIAVAQPEGVRSKRFRESIAAQRPDIGVVVAYGEILTRQLLAVPRLGFVNVHASLLPMYRGAAPIQAAIAAGDSVTGVTTMQVESGLDSGPMLLAREVPIGPHDTVSDLTPRLAAAGAALLVETLERLAAGGLVARRQDDAAASYAPRLTRADGVVDWGLTAGEVLDRWRAYTPWPGIVAEIGGESVKLLDIEPAARSASGDEGTVVGLDGEALLLQAGAGTVLAVLRAQRPGRRPVSGLELARALGLTAD